MSNLLDPGVSTQGNIKYSEKDIIRVINLFVKLMTLSAGLVRTHRILTIQKQEQGRIFLKVRVYIKNKNLEQKLALLRTDVQKQGKKIDIGKNEIYQKIVQRRNRLKNLINKYNTTIKSGLNLIDDLFKDYPNDFLIFSKIKKLTLIDDDITSSSVDVTLNIDFKLNLKYERFSSWIPFFKFPSKEKELGQYLKKQNKRAGKLSVYCWVPEWQPLFGCRKTKNTLIGDWYDIHNRKLSFMHYGGSDKILVDPALLRKIINLSNKTYKRYLVFHNKTGVEIYKYKVQKQPVSFFGGNSYLNIKNGILKEKIHVEIPVNILEQIHSVSFYYQR